MNFIKRYAEDVIILAGCVLVLVGTYQVLPVATWFVGGGMLIVIGVLIGLGGRA